MISGPLRAIVSRRDKWLGMFQGYTNGTSGRQA
jgi:hypothetical protein